MTVRTRFPIAALAALVLLALPSAARADAPQQLVVRGAYARPGANSCSWQIGTNAISKRLVFDAARGTYALDSFENRLTTPPRQYVDAGTVSPEFSFEWDGQTLTGATPGWSCRSGDARTVQVSGRPALELDVALDRTGVRVTRHYLLYPHESLIREWSDYANTGSVVHRLANPSFLEQRLMTGAAADGDVQLKYMTGTQPTIPGAVQLQTVPLGADYARNFDSYDSTACVSDPAKGDDAAAQGDPNACAAGGGFNLSSYDYMPWFSLWDKGGDDGVYAGFDYFGHWRAPIGHTDGDGVTLAATIPNYDSDVAPGASVVSPKAFVGTYVRNLDDMTNRLLDWQYRYQWDDTRVKYFTNIRMLGQWSAGAVCFTPGEPDYAGTLQKVFGLVDHMRTIGADSYHRDCGWWDLEGDWNGPDWRVSKDYLSKYGMQQLIYYWAYVADPSSKVRSEHPDWFTPGDIDLTKPDALKWMEDLLVGKAKAYGDYEWRNDGVMVDGTTGAQQLGQDAGLRTAIQDFLDRCPGCAFQGVNGGGGYIGWDYVRLASSFSFTDNAGYAEHDAASRLFPTDKLSGIPDSWDPGACDASYDVLLQFNPDFTGDTSDPQRIECMRRLVDEYHYLVHEGVAGRWVRQYHPDATDSAQRSRWFERLSWNRRRGLLVFRAPSNCDQNGYMCTGVNGHPRAEDEPVTVHPRGLDPGVTYDVRMQLGGRQYTATGAELMRDGITMQSVPVGQLIYLNLQHHPGAGTDQTAPQPPGHVTAAAGTNMGYQGVEVSWKPGSDDNWVSGYELLRDGKVIGTVAKGTYFFDHTAGASPGASYAVRTIDGDGNRSSAAKAQSAGGPAAVTADDAPGQGISYSGDWLHSTGVLDASGGTESTSASGCHTACQGFSDTQGKNGWRYQDQINGVWQDMRNYRPSGYMGMREWHDDTPQFGGYVWPTAEHPGAANDSARAWTAPKDGTLYIQSHPRKLVSAGNGVVVRITKNGTTVWGPQTIAGDDLQGVEADVNGLAVSAGDVIRFEINRNGDFTSDATTWDPEISYAPIVDQKAAAEYSFTGSQVTWYAHLGPNEGKAQVSIDGRPDTVVDLYAPDDNNHAIPIYGKAFGSSGHHTIRISETGERDAASTGTAISVDGFQVLTGDPSKVAGQEASGRTSFAFTGSQFTLVGSRCPACGEADVYVDGSRAGRIDTYGYRGAAMSDVPLFVKGWPKAGSHTVTVVPTGTKNIESTGTRVDIARGELRGG